TRPHFGGLRWWFVCPHLNRRVRKLYLPLGGRHFWSRRAYELVYASQRETKFDRALRRARKLRLRLGGDPADDEYPDKPPRMRWATYNRLMDRICACWVNRFERGPATNGASRVVVAARLDWPLSRSEGGTVARAGGNTCAPLSAHVGWPGTAHRTFRHGQGDGQALATWKLSSNLNDIW